MLTAILLNPKSIVSPAIPPLIGPAHRRCHAHVLAIQAFLPSCNPNITSDAKVGIHQLAGAACAAYQTALVNSPPPEEKDRLRNLLKEIRAVEEALLDA